MKARTTSGGPLRHPSPDDRHRGSRSGTARGSALDSPTRPPNRPTWVSVIVMPGVSRGTPISTSSKYRCDATGPAVAVGAAELATTPLDHVLGLALLHHLAALVDHAP